MHIIWTHAARNDLLEIRAYLKIHQSAAFVKRVTEQIRDEVGSLKDCPSKGIYVKELEEVQLDPYRELLMGQHRIIVERASEAFYVHIVCHTSRDLESLLRRRLLARPLWT
jgi:plasmid stabilization system protein ParE